MFGSRVRVTIALMQVWTIRNIRNQMFLIIRTLQFTSVTSNKYMYIVMLPRIPQASASSEALDVVRAAADAGAQGLDDIPAHSIHRQHSWRSFKRMAARSLKHRCTAYNVKTVVGADFACVEGERQVLLPHELAASMYAFNPAAFEHVMGTRFNKAFWDKFIPATPTFSSHPCFQEILRCPQRFIPIKLFEDDGGIGKHRSMRVAHWSAVLATSGSSLDTCFPMYIQHAASSLGTVTTHPLIGTLCWSFEVCTSGRWPEFDHLGQAARRPAQAGAVLCGGWRFIVTHVCMDGKAAVEAFHFPWSYKNFGGANAEICHLCFATAGGPRSYARFFDDHGPGRDTLAYLMSVCGRASPWSQLPGFRLDMVVPEVMHCGPLGCCLYAAGSMLWELCNIRYFEQAPGNFTTWQERLQVQLSVAFLNFKEYLTRNGQRSNQKKFTVRMLSKTRLEDIPYLKAKASNAMMVCDWLSEATAQQASLRPSEYGRKRAGMAWGLSTFFKILRLGGCPFLTGPELRLLRESRHAFLGNYHQLRALNAEVGRPLYPVTPKFHYLAHAESSAQESTINPKLFWTFKDEDQMRVMQRIALSAHATQISLTTLDKWIMQWFEHFSNM